LIIGALGEIIASGGVGISQDVQDLATNRFMDFFQTSVMASGFTHLPVPTPGSTGLFVSEISYDTSNDTWTVNDSRYTTAGALHAANELIWLEGTLMGRQTGYPQVAPIVTEEPEPPSVGDATAPMWAIAGFGAFGALLLVSGGLLVVRRKRA
ncbi:MAG: LPXTG cell wall anchor domain-containing protein, partial [Chloroflexi bacterium]|nr:LPXTG cell wall anchor domain-containing protein [Chloroflexota bacterium]